MRTGRTGPPSRGAGRVPSVVPARSPDEDKRMKLEHLTSYIKTNSKWIKDLSVRPETINVLEENIDRTLEDIKQSKIFYDPPLRAIEIKTKINKRDLIKLKSFCTGKETTDKIERHATEQE